MALTGATRVAVITRRGHSRIGLARSRDEAGRLDGGPGPRPRREQWAEARETDRKETFVKAMAAAFAANPPTESLGLAADARPPDAESGHLDIAPAAELPAPMNG